MFIALTRLDGRTVQVRAKYIIDIQPPYVEGEGTTVGMIDGDVTHHVKETVEEILETLKFMKKAGMM